MLERPGGVFVLMALIAGVGHIELLRHLWGDELEGMGGHEGAWDGDLDLRHVAGGAFTGPAVGGMMSVFGDGLGSAWPSDKAVHVAIHAEVVAFINEIRRMIGAVNVMAVGAANVPVGHE